MTHKIQLYSLATPNGQKVSIALEEMGLEYDAHKIDIRKGDQFTPEFIKINPNSKIPAIVDHAGPKGESISIMESGAILLYLAEKTNKFLSHDPIERQKTIQWLFFQMGGLGPMFGQFGHFYKYAKEECDHPYPLERYTKEAKRILSVVDKQLSSNTYMVGDNISIADFSIFPWIIGLEAFYKASQKLELDQFQNIKNWVERIEKREKVQVGMTVCPF